MPKRCSGEKVRRQMTRLGLTTSQLMAKSGLSESTIRRILANREEHATSDYTVQHLADALQCSPYDILRDDAIVDVVKTDSEFTVAEVLAEAVMEAVTVVTDNVAPDASPEDIAKVVPPLQVTPPPTLDVPSYFDYIKRTTDDHIQSLKKSRNTWRNLALVLLVLLLISIGYFVWELFNPAGGLSSILRHIYNQTPPPLS